MKKTFTVALATAAVALGAPVVHAATGDTVLRAKIINIDPSTSSSIPGLDVDNELTAELGLTYFLSPNWAMDLGVTTAKHDVTLNGAGIGTTKIWPVNVIAQYHFLPGAMFQPYVGAGVNYTRFSSVNILGGAIDLDKNSFGPVIQAGFDWPINNQLSLNVDVKKVWIDTDVSGAAAGGLDIDPVVYGVGIGYRF
jgi:outer membrane protein